MGLSLKKEANYTADDKQAEEEEEKDSSKFSPIRPKTSKKQSDAGKRNRARKVSTTDEEKSDEDERPDDKATSDKPNPNAASSSPPPPLPLPRKKLKRIDGSTSAASSSSSSFVPPKTESKPATPEMKTSRSTRLKKRQRDIADNDVDVIDDGTAVNPSSSTSSSSLNEAGKKKNLVLFMQVDKSSLLMHLENIVYHKHCPIFEKPIRPKDAPDYHQLVKRPIDISTIRWELFSCFLFPFTH